MAYDTQGSDPIDPTGSYGYGVPPPPFRNTSPSANPFNVGPDGQLYDKDGKPIGKTTPDAISGNYTPPAQASANPNYWSNLSTGIFGAMPTIPQAPAFHYDAFNAPAPYALPSGEDVLNQDPGFGFRRDQGLGALRAATTPLGLQNSGGTMKELIDYAGKSASQEYGNAADRSLNTYQTNFSDALNAWLANAGNAFNTYNTNYSTQYQNPYLAAMGQYQQKVGNQGQLFGQQLATATG